MFPLDIAPQKGYNIFDTPLNNRVMSGRKAAS